MMDYKGCKCASCHKVLKEGDDIVICPECGAPLSPRMLCRGGPVRVQRQARQRALSTCRRRIRPDVNANGPICPVCHAQNRPTRCSANGAASHARGRTAPGRAEQPTVCRAGYERHGHARRLRRARRAIRHRRRDDAAPSGQRGIRRHLHAGLDEVHRQFRAVLSVSVPAHG